MEQKLLICLATKLTVWIPVKSSHLASTVASTVSLKDVKEGRRDLRGDHTASRILQLYS